MPGVWRSVPRWLLDPEGPVAVRWKYLPSFLPWTLRFCAAGNKARLATITEAMNALNRPNIKLYRHHLQGTGQEALIKHSMYVHVNRNADDADLSQLSWRIRAERDAPLERVGKQELHEIEPGLSSEYQGAILIKGQALALDPGGLARHWPRRRREWVQASDRRRSAPLFLMAKAVGFYKQTRDHWLQKD